VTARGPSIQVHLFPGTSLEVHGAGDYATITTDGEGVHAVLHLRNRADADALVKAALAARDLLPEPEIEDDRRPVNYMACGDQLADDELQPPGTEWYCPNHGDTHVITQAQWLEEHPPEPSRDIVPGDLDAIPANRIGGPAPLPPATHCPVCGGKLDSNGAHVTRNGVSIPAAEVTQ